MGGINNLADYCASKFGILGFSESLRLELKHQGNNHVMVTTVCPFLVETGMFSGLKVAHPWLTPPLKPESVAEALLDAIKYRDREEIILPRRISLVKVIKLLPCWIYDELQLRLGSCDSFVYKK